jgi:hypothetical protein
MSFIRCKLLDDVAIEMMSDFKFYLVFVVDRCSNNGPNAVPSNRWILMYLPIPRSQLFSSSSSDLN